ncbi:LytR C-terminal domain-containing protein [Spelaeicoccus albus]|uniref:LytR/CpsA/Psr regulator C-terminal domain-containing protein n=1 Tax=Spelaeicoccus albus TaxID=1280376 RepID=A0A7Z0A7R8_9MICO|nr:LytR C-terminal domain-containing protein [Spelaeicoccus albus]NYI65942.1 hypothetical protein [Spelaeicoccus albus]
MPQQYPPDEFDDVTDSDRRGTHREKSARLGGVSSIVFVAIVVVVVALLGIAVVNIVNSGKAGTDRQSAISGDNGKSDSGKAGDKNGKSGKSSKKPSATKSTSKSPVAAVDKSENVQVLNSTTTAGMAARASEKLRDDGWSVSSTGNYGTPQDTTTVYYSSADLKPTAKALAKKLGTTKVEQSTQFATSVTVVLGSDYSDSQ